MIGKQKIKLYLVKREVKASSIRDALTKPGTVYAVELVNDEVEEKKELGFRKKK